MSESPGELFRAVSEGSSHAPLDTLIDSGSNGEDIEESHNASQKDIGGYETVPATDGQ